MASFEELNDRVERLLLRHQELQRTHALTTQQLAVVAAERDSLKSRLAAARQRVDALIDRLPPEPFIQPVAEAVPVEGRAMKRLEVTILGQSYLLSCPDDGENALTAAALRVDREMSTIRDAGKLKARERIAVLAALNLAFELSQRAETVAREIAQDAPKPPADARIDRLVARIDEVLTDDGRLL